MEPDKQEVLRDIANGLCDEAWEGRWETQGVLNTRPLAEITSLAVVRALEAKGYKIVKVSA